jgi:hypothetical protein
MLSITDQSIKLIGRTLKVCALKALLWITIPDSFVSGNNLLTDNIVS